MSKSMKMMMRVMCCAPLFAAVGAMGCDGEPVDDATELEGDDELVEDRELCIYNGPQSTDDSASLVGRASEVETYDAASAAPCDLHMFQVTAAPPSNRARTVSFHAHSYDGFSHTGARLWARTCTGGSCSAYTAIPVTLTVEPGLCPDPDILCVPSLVGAEVTLPGNNTYTDIRAGMRVIDGDDDLVPVSIIVAE